MDKSSRHLKNVCALYTLKELDRLQQEIANPRKPPNNSKGTPKSKVSSFQTQPAPAPALINENSKDFNLQPNLAFLGSMLMTPKGKISVKSGTGKTLEIKEKLVPHQSTSKKSSKNAISSNISNNLEETPNRKFTPSNLQPRKINLSSSSNRTDTRSQRKKASSSEVTLRSPVSKTIVKVVENSSMISNLQHLSNNTPHVAKSKIFSDKECSKKSSKSSSIARDEEMNSSEQQSMEVIASSSKTPGSLSKEEKVDADKSSSEVRDLRRSLEDLEKKMRLEVGKAMEIKTKEIVTLKKEVNRLEERNTVELEKLNDAVKKLKEEKETLESTLTMERRNLSNLKDSINPLRLQLEKCVKESNSSKIELQRSNEELKERNKVLTNELKETVESLAIDKTNFEEEIKEKASEIKLMEELIVTLKKELEEAAKSLLENETASKVKLIEHERQVNQLKEHLQKKDEEVKYLVLDKDTMKKELSDKERHFHAMMTSKEEDLVKAKTETQELSKKLTDANEKLNVLNNVKKKMLKKKDTEISHLKKKVNELKSISSSSTSSKRKRSESSTASTPLKKKRIETERRPSDDVDPVSDESNSLIIDESVEIPDNLSDISGGSLTEKCVSIDTSEHAALQEIFANEEDKVESAIDSNPNMISTPKKHLTVEERMCQLFGEDTDDSVSSDSIKSQKTAPLDVPGETLLLEPSDKTGHTVRQQPSPPYSPAKTSQVDHNYSLTTDKFAPDNYQLRLKDIKSLVADHTQSVIIPVLNDISPSDISNEAKANVTVKFDKASFELLKEITEVVKKCLNKFYKRGGGGPIKDSSEFESLARSFSHRFRDEIVEQQVFPEESENILMFKIDQEDKRKMIDRILLYFNVKETVLKIVGHLPMEPIKKLELIKKSTEDMYDKLKNTLESLEMLGTRIPLSLTEDFQLQIKNNITRKLYSK